MNYPELVAAISALMHRTDLSSSIATFISLAEAQLNRSLRVRQMELVLGPTTITDNRITLPLGVVDVKSLWVPGRESSPLEPGSFDAVMSSGLNGPPTMYSRSGADGVLINGSGEVRGIVYQQIEALNESSPDNWLLSAHPDVYLYGALVQAAIYTKDDKSVFEEQYTNALAGVTGESRRVSGSLRIRPR